MPADVVAAGEGNEYEIFFSIILWCSCKLQPAGNNHLKLNFHKHVFNWKIHDWTIKYQINVQNLVLKSRLLSLQEEVGLDTNIYSI